MSNLKEKADTFYKNKQYDDALKIYTQIINEVPEEADVTVYARLAIVQRFLKDYDASEHSIKIGLKKFPDNTSLLIEYAALENVRENWNHALKLWKQVKNQSKNFSELNYNRYAKAYLNFKKKDILRDTTLLESEIKILSMDKKLEDALLQNIKKRLIEIRNEKKDKLLAVKFIENSSRLFPSSQMLQKELAISYMHIHNWHKAIKVFETILYSFNNLFDAYDYERLAKCYEMIEEIDTYEILLLEAIKKYPSNQNLHFRYIYSSCISDYKNKEFSKALVKVNLLLGIGKPDFWNIDKNQLLLYRNECIKNIDIKSINSSELGMCVIASRADGLGERLNSMLNAIIIAKTFGYKFGYIWKNELHANHLQKDAEKNKSLVGHAVVMENDFFDESFISQYSFRNRDIKKFKTIEGKNNTYSSLSKLEIKYKLDGWISPRLDLKEHFQQELLVSNLFSYKDAFSFLKFNDDITYSISLANNIMKGDKYIALHLRSGDVFYGEYRKFLHYTYKGIVLPLAKALIEKYLEKNIKVIVFGQDLTVINYLKEEYNIVTVDDFHEYKAFNTTQKAMFEIILISRAESIIAGSSGFAKLASWIGDKELKSPSNYYSAKEQTAIIKYDLKKYASEYPKLQTSFAYWYAYFYGRNAKKISEVEYFLGKAYEFDPDNELYPLILASVQYKFNLGQKAEKTLCKLFTQYSIYDMDLHPASQVVQAKTMGKINIQEFIVEFEKAALDGNPFASVIMYILDSSSLKVNKSSIYLNYISKNIDKNDWLEQFYLFQKNKFFKGGI